MSPWRLNILAREIHQGAVFAYPTDTIWGLGCHPLRAHAVGRIAAIKQRPPGKGLILLCNRLRYCLRFINPALDHNKLQQVNQPQPRPTTWLVPASDDCPGWLTGGSTSIAIRICALPHIDQLCNHIRAPLVSTSANRSGHTPARNLFQVRKQFADKVDFIVNAATSNQQRASRIIDFQSGQILRE